MSENDWIIEAKKHFEENGNKTYISGDEISKKSQKINEKLKILLLDKFNNENEIELSLQGSKWSVQGQNRLTGGIWYRAYYKEFGKEYPIVLGTHIGKTGLNFAIQIYNNGLGNLKISQKLGEVIAEKVKDKNLESKKRDNKNERYSDYGYFNLEEFDDKKFEEIINVYKEIINEVNEELKLKLNDLIELYKKFIHNKQNASNPHILLNEKIFLKKEK